MREMAAGMAVVAAAASGMADAAAPAMAEAGVFAAAANAGVAHAVDEEASD